MKVYTFGSSDDLLKNILRGSIAQRAKELSLVSFCGSFAYCIKRICIFATDYRSTPAEAFTPGE